MYYFLSLIIILSLSSCSAFAGRGNFVAKSKIKNSSVSYREKSKCESIELEKCFDISKKDLRRFKIGLIDDLSSPKYTKEDLSVCSGLKNCQTNLAGKDCLSDHGVGSFGVINIDYTEAYCAKPNGFTKKDGLVGDSVGSIAADAEDATKAADKVSRSTKMVARKSALKSCVATLKGTPTNAQLKDCLLKLVRHVMSGELLMSEL